MQFQLICAETGERACPLDWCCPETGTPLEIANLPAFDPDQINHREWSLWRYATLLPVEKRLSLGAGLTPLVESSLDGMSFYAKLDYLNPTGSYKDRGTSIMLNHLLAHNVKRIVEDSSGNAGSSVALYASAANMEARIFVPEAAPAGKKRMIAMSADIVEIPGPRAAVTEACIAATTEPGVVYATHAWSPFFVAGQMTCAWEIWEQLGGRAPGAVVCPVGQGLLLLGIARGFAALKTTGLIERVPHIFGVQAAASDPVVRGYETGQDAPVPVTPGPTVADGIVIGEPVRGVPVMRAIRDSGGAAIRVEEADILPARDALARRGFFVEPTSATVAAALPALHWQYDGDLVLVLTGNGLKATQ